LMTEQRLIRSLALALVAALALAALVPWPAAAQGGNGGSLILNQGLRPIVREIAVDGNVEISTERILAMITSTRVGEPLDENKLREDVTRIAQSGYFEFVRVAEPVAYRDGVRVTFVVDEFPVIRAVNVTVVEDIVSPEAIRDLLDVRPGEILNATALTASIDPLPTRTWELYGYVLRVTGLALSGENGDELDVVVTPVRVGDILIEGNQKTRENVIRRELLFKSGDVLSMESLRLSLMRLGQLGYFEPIIPEFLERSDDPLTIDILLPIVENKTGRAAFGALYSSEEGLGGYIEVSDENFLGRGESASVKWEFSRARNDYEIGFNEPYLFGTNISAGFSLYNTLRRDSMIESGVSYPYTVRRTGGEVTLGRPLGLFTRGFISLRADNVSQTPDTEDSVVSELESRMRTVTAGIRTDTTDHLFYPTLGYRLSLSVETAGKFLGGDTEFTKYQTSFSRFFKAGRNNQTWAFRTIAGIGQGTLPLSEEFRVGGSETVRGYRFGEFRGDRMFVVQAEYRIPINQTIQGVIFVDAGNAWQGTGIDLGDLKAGYGIGIRFNTPLGVMRIDYGIGENGGNAYFSLGPTF